ncbi:MAG: FecR domain-containing protein [Verrucomicrobiota bacterium]
MLNEERQRELDRLLDGDFEDADRLRVQASLEDDQEAIDWLADRALMHANLRRSISRRAIEAEVATAERDTIVSFPRPLIRKGIAIAAGIVALLALPLWFQRSDDTTFVTLEQSRSALWQSGDLPTANGSRLGEGTLRLVQGLATLHFDSGAEVILEAPATLILTDEMNCELTNGTAVSDIPDSALGFRIKTPRADVVDYGTRFAVSVHEGTGETHTQVMEGKVQVEYAESDRIVELKTGQRNTVAGESTGEARDGAGWEHLTAPVMPLDFGPGWTLLETVKDAYTGYVHGHNSAELLCVKNAIQTGLINRVPYLGFDLSHIDPQRVDEAELSLTFSPTGWGLASSVPDATFSIFGLVGNVPEWDESILHGEFPGEPQVVHLGSFEVPQGVQKGRFQVDSKALVQFVRDHAGTEISLKVVRDTQETENGGLVHGFASRRHPVLPAPTLAIRLATE